jgi:anti-anti-sigma factor
VLAAQLATEVVRLLVDVSELRFADSTSVRALVLAARTLRERGGALVLLRPRPPVARVLELMGADQLIQLRPSARPGQLPATTRTSACPFPSSVADRTPTASPP